MTKKINQKMKTRKYKKKKNITKKKLRCSPNLDKNDFSCFDDENLAKLKTLWNRRHPDSPINTNDSKEIWSQMKQNLNNVCSKESCWIKQHFVNDKKIRKELKDAFAPEAPKSWGKNPNEWLSSVDIIQVLAQYKKTYKCFQYFNPSPIDYDTQKVFGGTVSPELADFNLANQMKKGKTKFGIIFNTDKHTGPGEHWIALYINAKTAKIFFFDSTGDEIPKQVTKFVNNVIKQGNLLKKPIHFQFDSNYKVEHQFSNSECGVYSLYFIIHMLRDLHGEKYFKTHILTDKYIEQFRKVYFNESL